MEAAHREFYISPEEFDEAAAELGRTLDTVGVPEREKIVDQGTDAGTSATCLPSCTLGIVPKVAAYAVRIRSEMFSR